MIIEITNQNFKEEINNEFVLVDFFATWCGPCKMMHPIVENITKELNIKTLLVDVDEFENLRKEYNISIVPTFIIFKNGLPVAKRSGYIEKEELTEWVANN